MSPNSHVVFDSEVGENGIIGQSELIINTTTVRLVTGEWNQRHYAFEDLMWQFSLQLKSPAWFARDLRWCLGFS